MDSRLMSVLQDDNYVKYGQESSLWPNDSVSMDMQLTETLDGILPITGNGDANDGLTSKNALIYSEFADQQFKAGDSIKILTLDTDDNDDDEVDDDDDEDDDNDVIGHPRNVDFDNESLCSYMTFRTRTDSSSIGDYESHSSDYEDDTDDDVDGFVVADKNMTGGDSSVLGQINFTNTILPADNLILDTEFKTTSDFTGKHRTLSTNTICSDIDGLGLQIDANNFDLADFITKDDFALSLTKTTQPDKSADAKIASNLTATAAVGLQTPVVQIISSKTEDSDSDSDLIIDVETVEIDTNDGNVQQVGNLGVANQKRCNVSAPSPEDDVAFVDNVKEDPSWSPKQIKKNEHANKESKQATTNVTTVATTTAPSNTSNDKSKRNICLVPNKKQCDFLKRKIGGKATAKTATTTKPTKSTAAAKKTTDMTLNTNKTMPRSMPIQAVGVGQGGKNLALLKHEQLSQETRQVEEKTLCVETNKPDAKETELASTPVQTVKRKLNLEEYKKRRGDVSTMSCMPLNKQQKLDNVPQQCTTKSIQMQVNTTKPQPALAPKTSPSKHNEAVAAIVKTLKTQNSQITKTDPITEAKNKVLRMQQLKRAQQLKILDSTVSAKVPRVTKLPPLKEIVKGSYFQEPETKPARSTPTNGHPDYEEIIIVSASCNTELTIPPTNMHKVTSKSSRSLLKSSVLLHNISDSFQKVQQATDKSDILTNSLIASIQHEVVKKAIPTVVPAGPVNSESGTTNAIRNEHHGEDKIIMYLPKNRERKPTVSMAVQTDMQPEFPMLTLLKKPAHHKSRERLRHKTNRSYRKRTTSSASRSCSASSASSNESGASVGVLRSGSECPSNASTERLRNSDATAAGGYSSRSTRRHRSSISSSYSEAEDYERGRRQRRTSYNKRRLKNYDRSNSALSTSSESDYEHSRARSRSPLYRRSRSRSRSRSRTRLNSYNNNRRNFVDRNVSQPAVEERRIVYVGRIEQDTTKDMLRRKFLRYGTIKQITIHYKETGMKYGFVTFERSQDAFTAIDSSSKDAQINMYDISFGGRRAFCRASYADLDNAGINNYESYVYQKPVPQPKEDDSFEALLLKVKAKMSANKPATTPMTATACETEHAPVSGSESKM